MTDPTATFTPNSPLRRPSELLMSMMGDAVGSRQLAWRLFVRDISAQYRQTLLGYLWVFIPPIAAAAPFILLSEGGVATFPGTPIPYAPYVLIGTTLWQVFVDALNAPIRAMSGAESIISRIRIAPEGIVISGMLLTGFGALIRLSLLAFTLIFFAIAPPLGGVFLFFAGLLALAMAGFAFGIILTPLGMLYKDISNALPVAASFLMLTTPVVYAPPQDGILAVIVGLNPLTPLVVATRDWLTLGQSAYSADFVGVTCGVVVCLLFAWVALRVAMPHITARLET